MKLATIKNECLANNAIKINGDQQKLRAIEYKVKKTIEEYTMISKDDTIMVAVSGGKDSTVLLYLLHQFGYKVSAVTVDAHIGCYSAENVKNIQSFCKTLNVPLHVASFNKNYGNSVCYITSVLGEKGKKLGTCTVCGVLRRRLLNKSAKELGASKVALGHNLDDECQAFLMNMFKNRKSLNARIGPKPGAIIDEGFVPRIKPLYFVSEEDVKYYSQAKGFPVKYGECPCSVKSYRYAIKKFMEQTGQEVPGFKERLMKFIIEKIPIMRKASKGTTPHKCKNCGEPSATILCRSCDILDKFRAKA